MNIKNIVKNTTANFLEYRKGNLWYEVLYEDPRDWMEIELDNHDQEFTPLSFKFPVPIEDTGDGIFPAKIKSISLMRYIRKHIKNIT